MDSRFGIAKGGTKVISVTFRIALIREGGLAGWISSTVEKKAEKRGT